MFEPRADADRLFRKYFGLHCAVGRHRNLRRLRFLDPVRLCNRNLHGRWSGFPTSHRAKLMRPVRGAQQAQRISQVRLPLVLGHRRQIRLLIRLILGRDLRLINLLLARLNFGRGNDRCTTWCVTR